MGKRSNKKRNPRDYYPTPLHAVEPLFKHLPKKVKFAEPCAGDGRLIKHLKSQGHRCVFASDIKPLKSRIYKRDILTSKKSLPRCDMIITNSPWKREILHAMIEKFTDHADTWLLIDADWAYTKQARPYKKLCKKIVVVGRVKWIEKSKSVGKDNCAWYFFSKKSRAKTRFIFH